MDELRALVSALPPELARQDFTHSSWTEDRAESYERLEFLGDAVLGIVVTDALFLGHPDTSEGHLATLRASAVNMSVTASIASGNDQPGTAGLGAYEPHGSARESPAERATDRNPTAHP